MVDLETAARLSRLAQQRYGAYGLKNVRVVAGSTCFILDVGGIAACFRDPAAMESYILGFGSAPLKEPAPHG